MLDVTKIPTTDLEREFINQRLWARGASIRALIPLTSAVLCLAALRMFRMFPVWQSEPEWALQVFEWAPTALAFMCAAGLVQFGGQAWSHLRRGFIIKQELKRRTKWKR